MRLHVTRSATVMGDFTQKVSQPQGWNFEFGASNASRSVLIGSDCCSKCFVLLSLSAGSRLKSSPGSERERERERESWRARAKRFVLPHAIMMRKTGTRIQSMSRPGLKVILHQLSTVARYLLLAVWLSMHASIASHSFGVKMSGSPVDVIRRHHHLLLPGPCLATLENPFPIIS